jgi:hypothetical protein
VRDHADENIGEKWKKKETRMSHIPLRI